MTVISVHMTTQWRIVITPLQQQRRNVRSMFSLNPRASSTRDRTRNGKINGFPWITTVFFIHFLYVQSAYLARLLCRHTFTYTQITTLSPNSSTNPISKTIATFIYVGGRGVIFDSLVPSIRLSSIGRYGVRSKIQNSLYATYKNWQWNFSCISSAAAL